MNTVDNQSIDNLIAQAANSEEHAEVIRGELVVTNKTTLTHNNAILEIASSLRQFIKDNYGKCKVFTENIALYCNELNEDCKSFFLPDVMAVCSEDGIREDGVHVAPLFVVEVTSDSTRKDDYGRKLATYSGIGVQEYWVVDLQKNRVVQYLSENEFAPEVIAYPSTSVLAVHSYPALEVDLSAIFE